MNIKATYVIFLILLSQLGSSQEGIPVFADYLSDNLYLVHPGQVFTLPMHIIYYFLEIVQI